VETPSSDPLADFIRNGMPSGPWTYPVVTNTSPVIACNLPRSSLVALHIHVFYPELLPEIMLRLESNAIKPDLFISVPSQKIKEQALDMVKFYQGELIEIEIVPNRGRDIGPLLTLFGQTILKNYEFVGHIHTKKTKDIKDRPVIWDG
jgi:lipopolysaccharide biosynthesis protein